MLEKPKEKCVLCGLENPEKSHFYKSHKITIKDYFETHFPRLNLLTRQKIKFKDKDSYFNNDFENRVELRDYLKLLTVKEKKEYCLNLLKRRIESKKLTYAPSQVELKSILIPAIGYFDELFKEEGGYCKLCESLGLVTKFKSVPESLSINPYNNQLIKIDTREQNPILYPHSEIYTLPYGDYTIDDFVYIERKNLQDFIQSFGKQVDRLEREIEKASFNNAYIVVLIESPISQAVAFDKLPWVKKFTMATPQFVFHNVRELCQKFCNLQFLFVDGRLEAKRIIPLILSSKSLIEYDLELLYEKGLL